jgi:hypothetical protein
MRIERKFKSSLKGQATALWNRKKCQTGTKGIFGGGHISPIHKDKPDGTYVRKAMYSSHSHQGHAHQNKLHIPCPRHQLLQIQRPTP